MTLPDGVTVRGTGVRRARHDVEEPDFALYLLGREPARPPWRYRWVAWPDFRRPRDSSDTLDALREAHRRAGSERVEIACGSGIGRTGTALAALAILSGVAPESAVGWVRRNYHRRAVETPSQRSWVLSAAATLAS